ncbi:MAG: PEP-utilizing enzyme [Actinomycetota bacterium]|nr:PEP-utilizing enzyme [Actinomycetota bacterium]
MTDLEDITNRISAVVAGVDPPGLPQSDLPYILLADDLAPADIASLNPDKVVAILIAKGGLTCHAAIIARSLEILTVVAVANLDKIEADQLILVDGDEGSITVGISEVDAKEAISKREVSSSNRGSFGLSKFRDGSRYNLLLNVGTRREIEMVSPKSFDGVGLFRTEFLYLNRSSEPTVTEQKGYYLKLFEKFEGKGVIVRTIDAGADKPLPFLGLADEVNPALGVHGFRVVNLHREVIGGDLARGFSDESFSICDGTNDFDRS